MTEEKKDNVIYVGSKPVKAYEESIRFQFEKNEQDEVFLKARGKNINKAFNVLEFIKGLGLGYRAKKIESGSDKKKGEKESDKGREIYVSSVSITLEKNKE